MGRNRRRVKDSAHRSKGSIRKKGKKQNEQRERKSEKVKKTITAKGGERKREIEDKTTKGHQQNRGDSEDISEEI